MAYDRKSYETLANPASKETVLSGSAVALKLDKQAAEIERLKSEAIRTTTYIHSAERETERYRIKADTLRSELERSCARVEELEAKYDAECAAYEKEYYANIELRTRLATSEDAADLAISAASDLEKLNDQLSVRLAEQQENETGWALKCKALEARLAEFDAANIELHERLASYEKAETVYATKEQVAQTVKQLMQDYALELDLLRAEPTIVKQTWQAVNAEGEDHAVHTVREFAVYHRAIGYVRRDHYSDGKVVATLEQIRDSK